MEKLQQLSKELHNIFLAHNIIEPCVTTILTYEEKDYRILCFGDQIIIDGWEPDNFDICYQYLFENDKWERV